MLGLKLGGISHAEAFKLEAFSMCRERERELRVGQSYLI